MSSCPECLSELRLDPARVGLALADIVGRGFYVSRPEGSVPFPDGPGCTLLRTRAEASLVFIGDEGFLEAHVDGRDHRAVPPLACLDIGGTELFRLERYRAADDALVAVGPDGAPRATYLRRPGALCTLIDVRDATSAPVAALRSTGRAGGELQLVETGGGEIGRVAFTDYVIDGWVDDQWSFRPLVAHADLPLTPMAVVAMVLAAKVLLGRPAPTRVQPRSYAGLDDVLEED